jgi:deazaflavin-dependent oxidoreductase (nitroreductase family)
MDLWIKIFTAIHKYIYRLTNGRLGSQLGQQSILLLYSAGAKTGKKYTTTLSYYRDGEAYLIVASNWGKPNHPGWFYNLLMTPHTTIQVKSKTIVVQAHPAEDDEYPRLWQLVTEHNRSYVKYQQGLHRRIPIVILSPVTLE